MTKAQYESFSTALNAFKSRIDIEKLEPSSHLPDITIEEIISTWEDRVLPILENETNEATAYILMHNLITHLNLTTQNATLFRAVLNIEYVLSTNGYFNDRVDSLLKNTKNKILLATKASKDIIIYKEGLIIQNQSIKPIVDEIQAYRDTLFIDKGGQLSVKTEVDNLRSELGSTYKDWGNEGDKLSALKKDIATINTFHEKCFTDTEEADSIETQLKDVSTRLEQLNTAHKKLIGYETEAGEKVQGSIEEFEVQFTKLCGDFNTFVSTSQTTYSSLDSQARKLLDNITTGTLAIAFNKASEKHGKSLKYWTYFFMAGLVALITIPPIAYYNIGAYYMEAHNNIGMPLLEHYLSILPFTLPILWFLLVASIRMNGYRTLYEEYIHKEALSIAFIGFSENVRDHAESRTQLLSKMVDAYGNNPTQYLKHVKADTLWGELLGNKNVFKLLGRKDTALVELIKHFAPNNIKNSNQQAPKEANEDIAT